MRILPVALAAFALTASAFADTLKEVTTHGIILNIGGMDIDITYTPDGKFTGLDGQLTGTWKIKDDALCTTSNFAPDESCSVYPKDKKSGDSFELTGPDGTVVTIKIK